MRGPTPMPSAGCAPPVLRSPTGRPPPGSPQRGKSGARFGPATIDASPSVPPGLLDLLPPCGLGQVEVPRNPAHRPVPALAQLNELGLELRRERGARPGFVPPHALHGRTSFLGRTPDGGCP